MKADRSIQSDALTSPVGALADGESGGPVDGAAGGAQVPTMTASERPDSDPVAAAPRRGRLHWWMEILYIAGFYLVYSVIRDIRGTKPLSVTGAYDNAKHIISVERFLDIFHEAWIQAHFLDARWLIKILDLYYGSLHFLITAGVLAWLFFRVGKQYRLWRNVLAATTALALIGFALFPLMPPRLLPPSYHFVDTLKTIGGLWNFNSGPMTTVSDQFAAMPSLHTAWAAWCAWAIICSSRRRLTQILAFLYPVATIFTVVITGNHYFLDAVGGLLTLLVGYLLGAWFTVWCDARLLRRGQRSGHAAAVEQHPPGG